MRYVCHNCYDFIRVIVAMFVTIAICGIVVIVVVWLICVKCIIRVLVLYVL